VRRPGPDVRKYKGVAEDLDRVTGDPSHGAHKITTP
jgi:hypothetical protein